MIIVNGASGQLGRRTLEHLLKRVPANQIRAISRDPSKLADFQAQGIATARADLNEPSSLPEAYAGGDVLYLISTDDLTPGTRVRQHKASIDAAKASGIRQVVYSSCTDPRPENPFSAAVDHRGTEEALAKSGLAWTSLRNNFYAELLLSPGAYPQGSVVGNWGEGQVAYVTRDDCASVAAAVLTDPGRYANQALEVTGPDLVGLRELAQLVGDVAGRVVEAHIVDDDAFADGLQGSGLPDEFAHLLLTFGQSVRGGWFGKPSPTVLEVTGHPPTTPRAFLEANRDALLATLGGG